MAPRKKPEPRILERTPVAEWAAAGLGLALALAVLGYSLWEAAVADQGPPDLSASAQPALPSSQGFTVPIVVRNRSHQTAAAVEVRGELSKGGAVVEERRAALAYVPGRGEATGGLVFQRDPAGYTFKTTVEGYADP
jgi:uncharacterized protein (TIGR02588 family)